MSTHNVCFYGELGPAVQSIVSLTSLLRVISYIQHITTSLALNNWALDNYPRIVIKYSSIMPLVLETMAISSRLLKRIKQHKSWIQIKGQSRLTDNLLRSIW